MLAVNNAAANDCCGPEQYRKRGKNIEPMLSAYPDMNEEFKQDIMTDDAEMK